jgi:hypothetical protein
MLLLFFSACPNGDDSIQSRNSERALRFSWQFACLWHTASTQNAVTAEGAPLTNTTRMFDSHIALLTLVLCGEKQHKQLRWQRRAELLSRCRDEARLRVATTRPSQGKVVGARSALLISASQHAGPAARADCGGLCTPQTNPAYAALLLVRDSYPRCPQRATNGCSEHSTSRSECRIPTG